MNASDQSLNMMSLTNEREREEKRMYKMKDGTPIAQVFFDAAEEDPAQPLLWPCVMIDIETLATSDDAVILEIAAVCFDWSAGKCGPTWSMAVDLASQPLRRIDAETLAWWMDSERSGQLSKLLDRSETKPELWHGLHELTAFISGNLAYEGEVWAKGDFDPRILGNAYASEVNQTPWKYYQVRELRTVLKLAGVESVTAEHRAMADALSQVEQLFAALHCLGGARYGPADLEAGWEEYRRHLAETRATLVPAWAVLHGDVREAWCVGVMGVLEAGMKWKAVDPG